MRILVTGARGLVGRSLLPLLEEIGDIRGTDLDSLDVTEASSVTKCFEEYVPDIVVHLAARKGNAASRQRPDEFFRVNTLGTLNLLEGCRRHGVKEFVFLSSATVHGQSETPVDESSPVRPLHPYGASKASAEAFVHAYSKSYGINAVILRPNFIVGAIYQPEPYTDNIIYDFLRDIDARGVIELAGDGSYEREWVHPTDVALAVKAAILSCPSGCETFMLAGHRQSMKELAKRIIAIAGKGEVRAQAAMPGFTLVSSSMKAKHLLGWQPRYELDMIIKEIWDEYAGRQNHHHHRN